MTNAVPSSERSIVTLGTDQREAAVPVLQEGFAGIYRWHAKRTLRSVSTVRALRVGGRIAGVSLLERLTPEVGYVYYLSVGLEFRRQGIGGALLDDALAHFGAQGATVVYGAVEEDNRSSRRLFESRRFRLVDRDETNYRLGGLGAQGLRTRMWIVHGEVLYGLRLPGKDPG